MVDFKGAFSGAVDAVKSGVNDPGVLQNIATALSKQGHPFAALGASLLGHHKANGKAAASAVDAKIVPPVQEQQPVPEGAPPITISVEDMPNTPPAQQSSVGEISKTLKASGVADGVDTNTAKQTPNLWNNVGWLKGQTEMLKYK